MKAILITFTFFTIFSVAKGQQADTTNRVYTIVDQYPTPSDNWSEIRSNKKYPKNALENGIEGEIFITFVVEKDGSLTNIKVRQGIAPDLDAEAIRVISSSHKWSPGMQDGKLVRVQRSVVLYFELPATRIARMNLERRTEDSLRNLPDGLRIFSTTQVSPSFPGGRDRLFEYIHDNLKYPNIALKNGVYGNVMLRFIIERDGSLSDIKLWKGLTPETDAEAIRLMKACPNWIPAMQDGIPVRLSYGMTIPFELPVKTGN